MDASLMLYAFLGVNTGIHLVCPKFELELTPARFWSTIAALMPITPLLFTLAVMLMMSSSQTCDGQASDATHGRSRDSYDISIAVKTAVAATKRPS